ncbi:MAG: flavodoxin family protein [Candidatus Omnitrophota bacterium]
MKLLLISSSPRRENSNTFVLAKEVLKGCLNECGNPEIIHLADLNIGFCRSCEGCHKEILRCSIGDNLPAILNKMLEADGIIIASPNYINQVTASMKALFDRSSHFIHCKRLLGKHIIAVVSSGGGEDDGVLDYIKYYAHTCGAQYSGGVSSRVPLIKERMEEARGLGASFVSDIREKREYPEQTALIEKEKQYFAQIIKIRKNEWQEEYRYWQEKGWL